MTKIGIYLCGMGFAFGTAFGLFISGELWLLRNLFPELTEHLAKIQTAPVVYASSATPQSPSSARVAVNPNTNVIEGYDNSPSSSDNDPITSRPTKTFSSPTVPATRQINTVGSYSEIAGTAHSSKSFSSGSLGENEDTNHVVNDRAKKTVGAKAENAFNNPVTHSTHIESEVAEDLLTEEPFPKVASVFENKGKISVAAREVLRRETVIRRLNNLPIDFDANSVKLNRYSDQAVKLAALIIADFPHWRFEVSGHTDSSGGLDYNLRISKQRAQVVVERLVWFGIDPASINATGYGPSRPIASNLTRQGRIRNRRIEFQIVDDQQTFRKIAISGS